MSAEGSGLVPGDHPDRIKWNAKYGTGFVPSFRRHPLAVRGLDAGLPEGPVADLACGPSGAALLAAEQGRRVTAVDVSEVALGLLGAEARRRGLDHLITLVHADLSAYNLLYHAGRLVAIDFPQAVDPRFNDNAPSLLARDLGNVCQYFGRFGVESDPNALADDMWDRFIRGCL